MRSLHSLIKVGQLKTRINIVMPQAVGLSHIEQIVGLMQSR